MKRIFLFLVTNIAVMVALMVVFHVLCAFLGVDPGGAYSAGGDVRSIMLLSVVFGMAGGFVSLLLSKTIAKWSTGARTIDGTEGERERRLVEDVRLLAERANISMPEVAVYEGAANAFATGAFRNHALVAVSTGLLDGMSREETRAVLGHEISHVANGDMVTMTLLQGVLNACVIFLSRVAANIVASSLEGNRRESRRSSPGAIYFAVYYLLQITLGILASIVVYWYSRRREYAADRGSASLMGTPLPMIAALRRLGGMEPSRLPDSVKALGVRGGGTSLFSTHPSIEDRIAALENLGGGQFTVA